MDASVEIKLFMRDCWNNVTPADEFFEKIHERYSQKDIQAVGLHLLSLIGRANRQATFVISYVSRLLSDDPISFISAIDDSDDRQVIGLARMIASFGDTMFDNLDVGSEEAARCAVRALKLVMSKDDRQLVQGAVKKLAMSPNFAILVASGRVFCRDEFREVAATFRYQDPLNIGGQLGSLSLPPLVTAINANALMSSNVISAHLGIIDLYAFAAHMWKMDTEMNSLDLPVLKKDVFKHLFRRFISSPSLLLAYCITNLCVRSLKPEIQDRDEALRCIIRELHQEDEDRLRTHMSYEDNPGVRGIGLVSPFPEEMSVDEAIDMLTARPDHLDMTRLLDQALEYPAIVQDVGPLLISKLKWEHLHEVIPIVDHFMTRVRDFRVVLTVQKLMTDIERALAELVVHVRDEATFQSLWFFLVFFIYAAESSGSEMVIEETKRFVASCEEPIRSALGLFLWDTEIDLARGNVRTFEDFDMMPSFTTKCYEFVMLLGGTGDLDRAAQYVKEHPYLWPSVFMWTMKTQDQRAQIFMKMKPPNHKLLNTMLKHVAVCLRDKEKNWNSVLANPSFDVCKRFGPKSIEDLHLTLGVEVGFLASVSEINKKFLRRIVISWRAWIALFGIGAFIDSLLEILMWTVQVGRDPYFAMNCFRCVASSLAMICDKNKEIKRQIVRKSMSKVTSDLSPGVAGTGIAEFCLIIAMGSDEACAELFGELLEFRKQLLAEGPVVGSAQVGFCVGLIKAGIYLPLIQNMITPDVFDKLMVKHEWQAAIDYFVIRSKQAE